MHDHYTVTMPILQSFLTTFNRVVFSNKLDLDKVSLVIEDDLDTELGYCFKEDDDEFPVLGVIDIYEDQREFEATLVHEMIHLYQYQICGEEPGHDSNFIKMATTAAKLLSLSAAQIHH
jgi:hypothetical protein